MSTAPLYPVPDVHTYCCWNLGHSHPTRIHPFPKVTSHICLQPSLLPSTFPEEAPPYLRVVLSTSSPPLGTHCPSPRERDDVIDEEITSRRQSRAPYGDVFIGASDAMSLCNESPHYSIVHSTSADAAGIPRTSRTRNPRTTLGKPAVRHPRRQPCGD